MQQFNIRLSAINFKKEYLCKAGDSSERHRRDSSALLHRNFTILWSSGVYMESIDSKGLGIVVPESEFTVISKKEQ